MLKTYKFSSCSYCGGRGVITCPNCRGSGAEPLVGGRCRTCNGSRVVTCPKCKGRLITSKKLLKG